MSDFMLILSLLYCWLSGGSALVLRPAGEKPKKSLSSWVHGKLNFLEKLDFCHFFYSNDCMKMLLNT